MSQTLPSTEVLTYTYNDMGALSSLSGANTTYVSQIHYNASGQVTDQLLGVGLRQQFCYDSNTLRVTGLRFYPGSLQGCVVANPAQHFEEEIDDLKIFIDEIPNSTFVFGHRLHLRNSGKMQA